MKLSVEILDRIFSFTTSDRETLIACSKDSALSPLVEKHLYHHVIVHIGNAPTTDEDLIGALEPNELSKLVSENPRIRYHVRILQIQVDFNNNRKPDAHLQRLDDFAKSTMLEFPVLVDIMLTAPKAQVWHWSDAFRTALEDRLKLPTMKGLHLTGSEIFQVSLLDHCKGIANLSLSGLFLSKGEVSGSALPQLTSLVLKTHLMMGPILGWLQSHTKQLQSLECRPLTMEWLPKLLESCSGTLKRLEIDLVKSLYFNKKCFRTGKITTATSTNALSNLSPISNPLDLQQLSIYTGILLDHHDDHMPDTCTSWLPAAADLIKFLISSSSTRTRHLILDIDITLLSVFPSLANVDFGPLVPVLGAASELSSSSSSSSIQRVDVYVHTDVLPSALTRAGFFASLVDCEDVLGSIKESGVVFHWEECAPDLI